MRHFNLLHMLWLTVILAQESIQLPVSDTIHDTLTSRIKSTGDMNLSFHLTELNESGSIYTQQYLPIGVDTILVSSESNVKPSTIQLHFKGLHRLSNTKDIDDRFRSIVNSYNYFSNSSSYLLGKSHSGKMAVKIFPHESFSNTIMGLAGASRNEANEWALTGEASIHMENIWKSAGTVDVYWKRLNEETQLITFELEEPYLINLPVGGHAVYNQELRDGLYVKSRIGLQAIFHTEKLGKWKIGSARTRLFASPQGDSAGINSFKESSVLISQTYQRLDNRWIPRKGLFMDHSISAGSSSGENENIVLGITSNVSWYIPVISSLGLSSISRFAGVFIQNNNLHQGYLTYFGGANSLRGYSDEFFKDEWVGIESLEFSFYMPDSRMYLFFDGAVAPQFETIKVGAGFGYSQVLKSSIISIEYGMGLDHSITSGKLHFSIVNRL